MSEERVVTGAIAAAAQAQESELTAHETARELAARSSQEPELTATPVATLSRRRFLEGLGAVFGVAAAGVIPAVASSVPVRGNVANAAEEVPVATGDPVLDKIIAHNQPINYPGRPVKYADPAGGQNWAMVIDVKACIGCRKCVYSCVKENNIGRDSGFTYIQVLEMEPGGLHLEHGKLDYENGGDPDKWYLPVQCMQCAKPTCVYGCPVKATWKEPDGIVVMDYDKCIEIGRAHV